ncbi:MAG: TraR/DksA C4-type zinc finger protein [Candidatus Thiodiazotropha sp. (ex Dulcina madagascariensis)]|nr:TraR/DksA C4-type zinc finger protein [Candidatus Thiodiazotropha sp. (ex Epidulcina cf. delphinae)]MCU7921916.1 TraR/DksA C4-type zinc finger protein [Candidatus Thiodiazotropha sp. (ex Dulcina madagascariensis)]MCU7924853.1 TraR/DksA C4-type zinc finger protein [Candidatus Thiodiazotropha sp. (ex Dulcina madagascariensis)]
MNRDEIELIRERLLHLQADLQAVDETSQEAGKTVELDQSRVGRLTRMDAIQAQQMAQETARRRHHQRLMIEGALRRIDSGEYGYCFVCGEEIDARRLSVDPTVTRCITCVEE